MEVDGVGKFPELFQFKWPFVDVKAKVALVPPAEKNLESLTTIVPSLTKLVPERPEILLFNVRVLPLLILNFPEEVKYNVPLAVKSLVNSVVP